MNFIIKYRRSDLHSRRGMILLVVMAVLSFFAVMGMTFILMTGKNRDSAETAQLAAQNSKTAGNSPQELLEEGIMQVLVGPPTGNAGSALLDRDLIGDMYGGADDDNLEKVTASFNNNVMTPAKAEYAGRIVTIAEGAYKGQSTIILNSGGAIIPFASGIGSSDDYAVSNVQCVINKKRAFQKASANYDAVDINNSDCSNDFMSLRFTGATDPDIDIKVGRVVVPSYYRDGARPGLSANTELGGESSGYQDLSSASFKTAATPGKDSPWDVDNDGDGDNDSVWMNLGLPPRPMPDGTLVVPMYAILVEDMDGRLNVNAHSPDVTINSNAGYMPLGSATVVLPEGESIDPTTMLNGQGFGPADVNLEALFGSKTSDIIAARRFGESFNSGLFDYRFPDLTGLRTCPFGVESNNKNARTPLDFYGVMAGAIDQNGMFVWQKRGTVGNLSNSSYERDLGLAMPKGTLVGEPPYKQFSPEELEGVLRVYDDDSKKLESRLIDIVKTVDDKDKNTLRNLITTESWDMPYCNISDQNFDTTNLPEEIQAGFKMDINRPLTSYEDDPDVADAERTQLAKDLYNLIIKVNPEVDHKVAAQWAVNAVDFRDADSVCTYLNYNGNEAVWGCERPELLITETFAFHARMTEDSELGGWRSDQSDKCARSTNAAGMIDAEWYDKKDCPEDPQDADIQAFCQKYEIDYSDDKKEAIKGLMDNVREHNCDGIADMDQICQPESGLFIELYNPWLSAGSHEATPDEYYTSGSTGIDLGGKGKSGKMVDSAWRIAVAGGVAGGIKDEKSWAKDLREEKYQINRVLYFGSSAPEKGDFTYIAGSEFCVRPGEFAVIGPEGNTYLCRNEKSGNLMRPIRLASNSMMFDNNALAGIRVISVPDSNSARFSVTDIGTYNVPVDESRKLTEPRDMPYDADDHNRWTDLDGIGHGLGEDFEQPAYRVVYLQRLANPYKAYNETTNPYITFDQMPVDLFSYSGRQNTFADYKDGLGKGQKATDADELAYKHADVFIKSRQRGETQVFAGSTCANFWTSEKIPGDTKKDNNKLTMCTSAPTSERVGILSAVKSSIYQSFGSLDPFNSESLKLISTTPDKTNTPVKLPSYQSVPPYYFPNRPFNSVMELMLVPQVSAYELTSSLNAIDKPASGELLKGNLPKYLHPTNGIDFLSESGSKIFNYVRVQTPFAVTPMNVNTYCVDGENQAVSTNADEKVGYRWTFREPGKININSITHPAVWAALLGAKTETAPDDILGLTANMYNDYWGKIFTDNNPGTRPRTFGASSANYIAANYQIFKMKNTEQQCQSAANNVYFQTQLMQRLSNLTTTRSNVFAVWVTVGFFEFTGTIENPPEGVSKYKVGKEYGLDNGSRQRYRAFYLIDRTRPVGYSPGKRMNADKTIILRRYLP